VGRLWDLCTRGHRHDLTEEQRAYCTCLACDCKSDRREHWLMECSGSTDPTTAGPMGVVRQQMLQAAVDDLGGWVRQLAPAQWVVLAAGGMPPDVLSLCKAGEGKAGDTRTIKKRAYRLQRHAIRLGHRMWHMSRREENARLLRPDLLDSERVWGWCLTWAIQYQHTPYPHPTHVRGSLPPPLPTLTIHRGGRCCRASTKTCCQRRKW
jgi:hypothetical protein